MNCPRLKSIRFAANAFSHYHSLSLNELPSLQSIEMEYNCFSHSSLVLVVTIDELTRIHRPPTTSIHTTRWCCIQVLPVSCIWEWEIEWMNEQIFLHSLHSKEKDGAFSVLVPWFLRVITCEFINIDIPQLSSDGTVFDEDTSCFYYTYSLQSSSNPSPLSSPFDATALESAIRSKSKFV